MSNKGNKLSVYTRLKISNAKTVHTKGNLIKSAYKYLDHLEANPTELPTLSGYCLVAGIHPTNLRDYVAKYPEVDLIASHISLMQEQYCLVNGIKNRANPIFSMFLLKSKHNYLDQPKQLTQNNNFGITPDLLADALKLMNAPKTLKK